MEIDDKKENFSKRSGLFQKITSKYIIKHIFQNLSKGIFLNFIRYNKSLQQIFELTIKDYKEYSELYSPIEFELIPASNKYGKFINLSEDDSDQKYYHIFFNDSNEEQDICSLDKEENDKINKIKIIIDHNIKSFEKLFEDCKCIESIKVKKFSRINIEDMRAMFWECTSLKEINLEKFKTNEVTNMSWMFFNCKLLKKANISQFSLNSIEKMVGMFWGCESLEEINLPSFNNINNIDMKCMFSECSEELKDKVKALNNNINDNAFK